MYPFSPKTKIEHPANLLPGIWCVDGAEVGLFDPREPERPAWYPENFFCQSPWPVASKVKAIELIEEYQKTCKYEFDETGRLVTVSNTADVVELPKLLRKEHRVIFADAGYTSDDYKKGSRHLGLSWCVNDKLEPGKNQSSSQRISYRRRFPLVII